MAAVKSGVNDKWMFLILYPVMALSVIFIGNDNSFTKLLSIPSFYTDLILAFICTYGVGLYFRSLFIRIDQKFDWDVQLRRRLVYQAVWTLLVPTITLILIEIAYLNYIEIPIKESSVFYLELPVILLFCTIINFIYLLLYYQKHTLEVKASNPRPLGNPAKDHYLVKSGLQYVNVRQEEISYFIVKNKITFLVTTDGRSLVYENTLKRLSDELTSQDFFQLNRQVIATRRGIVSCKQTGTRRLEIILTPSTDEPVFVAKTNVTQFFGWFNDEQLSD